MSQNDFTIANQTFPNTRADINSALQALASTSSGSSAPSTTFANQFFYNTTSNLLQIRNEDNDAFITIAELDQTADNVEYFKSTSIRLARIEFEDGDDALSVADGGALTVSTSLDMNGTELILDADADTSIHASTDDQIDFKTGGTDRVTINSDGVGVNTTSPQAPMHIIDGAGAVSGASYRATTPLVLENNANTELQFFSGSSSDAQIRFGDGDSNFAGAIEYGHDINSMLFYTSSSERVRFDSGGRVYINGSTSLSTSQTSWRWDISGINYGNRASAGTMQSYRVGGTAVGSIYTGASSTTYNTSSDYRLKENVDYTWDATTRLKQLKPARFNFIADDTDTLVDGFIAHEVSSIVPEAITGTQDAMCDEEYEISPATGDIYTPSSEDTEEVIHSNDVERPDTLADGQFWRETTEAVTGTRSVPDYQGIDQSKLVPLLVKTIQELEARITALES